MARTAPTDPEPDEPVGPVDDEQAQIDLADEDEA